MVLEGLILHYYLKVFSILFFIIFIICFIFGSLIINKNYKTNSNIINISKGENIEDVINNFFPLIMVHEKIIFKIYYRINYLRSKNIIHYGDFKLEENFSFRNLLRIISRPSNILNKITVVEGWSISDLNKELSKYFKDFQNIEYFDILADTYYFEKDKEFEQLLKQMLNFKKNYLNRLLDKYDFFKKFSENDLMIIGSLIEKEGLDFDDKRKISSVIFNRLEKDMKLQIDATVLYSITNGKYDLKRSLLISDLKIEHPYNTYKFKGLPPQPISYVGTKTVDLILENYKSEYLFYFFNNSLNKHIFSSTFDEHLKKLNEYRKNE